MADFETLIVETIDDAIIKITINRPDSANALSTTVARELVDAVRGADSKNVRCILLTGAGERAFSAGADLKERNGLSDQAWKDQHKIFQTMVRTLLECPVPLIAAVNGAAIGGGFEIALCSDFIYASETARFALTEVTLGIMPGSGGTQNLPRTIGLPRAKEMLYTGRALSAEDAYAWGVVNRICTPDKLLDDALDAAKAIASNAPLSVKAIKAAVNTGTPRDLHNALALELELYNTLLPTDDRREGILAFHEKRKARFKGA